MKRLETTEIDGFMDAVPSQRLKFLCSVFQLACLLPDRPWAVSSPWMALLSPPHCSLWIRSTPYCGICGFFAPIYVKESFMHHLTFQLKVWSFEHHVYYCYRKFPSDLSALLLGDLYYTRLSLSGVSEHLTHSALLDLYLILHTNLSSNISKVGSYSSDVKEESNN